MAGRYFNWKLAIVLLMGLVVLGTTALGLRQWQKSRRAEQGLVVSQGILEILFGSKKKLFAQCRWADFFGFPQPSKSNNNWR